MLAAPRGRDHDHAFLHEPSEGDLSRRRAVAAPIRCSTGSPTTGPVASGMYAVTAIAVPRQHSRSFRFCRKGCISTWLLASARPEEPSARSISAIGKFDTPISRVWPRACACQRLNVVLEAELAIRRRPVDQRQVDLVDAEVSRLCRRLGKKSLRARFVPRDLGGDEDLAARQAASLTASPTFASVS